MGRISDNHAIIAEPSAGEVKERTPIAFAQIRGTVALIDGDGVVMEMPRHR